MAFQLHPIPSGLWCVPSAIACLTGEPHDAVIHPALNRHMKERTLTGMVVGATTSATLATLAELGYAARAYRHNRRHHSVKVWARRSVERYPGRPLLLLTRTHALVAMDGRVYDNHYPHGPVGDQHSFAGVRVDDVYLVERRRL